jgi:DNA-binding transcriptional LysR family regulator
MQIRALEERLGIELFRRAGRAVRLTEAGEALVPLARDITHRAVSIEEAMASLHGDVVGLLKLVCSTTAGKYVLPKILAGLQALHPAVQVACHVVNREVALERLEEGEAHVGLASMADGHRQLEYRPFLVDRIVLITRPDHPWARSGEPIIPRQLIGERFIMRESTSGTAAAVREGLGWHDLTIDNLGAAMILGNSEAIRMAVQEGIGIGFVSALAADEAIEAGKLTIVPIEGMELTKTLYLIRNPNVPATRAGAAFWDFAFAAENEAMRKRASEVVAAS